MSVKSPIAIAVILLTHSLCLPRPGFTDTLISGVINQPTVWTEAMSPVRIEGEAVIPSGVRVEVEPGALVRFADGARLTVRGSFDCQGASKRRIRFEPAAPESPDPVIEIEGDEGEGRFERCDFKKVGVRVSDLAAVLLERCLFSEAEEAIHLSNARSPGIVGCHFVHVGSAVRSIASSPEIRDCRFEAISSRAVHLTGLGNELAPPSALRIRGPNRMVANKRVTLRVEAVDSAGYLHWPMWKAHGQVVARRADSGAPVALSTDAIEFTNGVGCVTLSLTELGEIDIEISVDGVAGTHRVTSFDLAENRTFALGLLPPGDQIWRPEGGVYHLTGRVVVGSGSRLILEAGTLLMLDYNVEIEVYGGIEIRGTEENPVHFFPTETYRPWNQLRIRNTQNIHSIRHAYFVGGGDGPKETAEEHTFDGPMLRFRPHDDVAQIKGASIEGCTFADGYGKGIFSHNGERYEVRDCLFTRLEFGLEMHGDEVSIADCQVVQMNKGGEKQDGMYFWRPTDHHTIDRCIVTETGDDGIDAFESSVVIRNSLVYGATDKNITLFASDGVVENCLIFGAGYGCFVREEPGKNRLTLTRSTLLDHFAFGIRVDNLAGLEMDECILAENAVPLFQSGTTVTVSHSAFDSLPAGLSGSGNVQADPDFIDESEKDFRLQPDSPLRTAGPNGSPIGWQGFPGPGLYPPLLEPRIESCRFIRNATAVEVEGGAALALTETLIADSETALSASGANQVRVDRSTLAGCGLAYVADGSAIEFVDCILWENADAMSETPSAVTFDHSTFGPIPPPNLTGAGNLSEDPLFLNPEGEDYRLRADSTSAGSGTGGADRGAFPSVTRDERGVLRLY